MRRDVERRLSALESQTEAENGPRVILLVPVGRNEMTPRTYRDCRGDLAWERAPEETAEEFEARAVAEAEEIAKAHNRVMMLARLSEPVGLCEGDGDHLRNPATTHPKT
jgi:hypothetical protein